MTSDGEGGGRVLQPPAPDGSRVPPPLAMERPLCAPARGFWPRERKTVAAPRRHSQRMATTGDGGGDGGGGGGTDDGAVCEPPLPLEGRGKGSRDGRGARGRGEEAYYERRPEKRIFKFSSFLKNIQLGSCHNFDFAFAFELDSADQTKSASPSWLQVDDGVDGIEIKNPQTHP